MLLINNNNCSLNFFTWSFSWVLFSDNQASIIGDKLKIYKKYLGLFINNYDQKTILSRAQYTGKVIENVKVTQKSIKIKMYLLSVFFFNF